MKREAVELLVSTWELLSEVDEPAPGVAELVKKLGALLDRLI